MYNLLYSEFYITHVCNLACEQCNRFNNYAFQGHFDWQEHRKEYQAWSKLIKFDQIGILGGEPLLHPKFYDWLHGIAELWPDSEIKVMTNGTLLLETPELYETLVKYDGRVFLEINEHDPNNIANLHRRIMQFMPAAEIWYYAQTWQECYSRIKQSEWPDCDQPEDFFALPSQIQDQCRLQGLAPDAITDQRWYTDTNNVRILYSPSWNFVESAVKFNGANTALSLHNSDPASAMKICMFDRCHHFVRGKLHKCGPTAILPDFIQQFAVDISEQDQALIQGYEPASADWHQDKLEKFLYNLVAAEPIDQCKFCPESFSNRRIKSLTKKPKVIKIKSVV